MKKLTIILLVLLLVLIPMLVFASDVTLQWNPNTEPDIAKYRIYQSQTSGTYGDYVAEINHPTTEYVITGLTDGKYYWTATAVDFSGNESLKSLEVSHVFSSGSPSAPQNIRIKIVIEIPMP